MTKSYFLALVGLGILSVTCFAGPSGQKQVPKYTYQFPGSFADVRWFVELQAKDVEGSPVDHVRIRVYPASQRAKLLFSFASEVETKQTVAIEVSAFDARNNVLAKINGVAKDERPSGKGFVIVKGHRIPVSPNFGRRKKVSGYFPDVDFSKIAKFRVTVSRPKGVEKSSQSVKES